MTNPIEFHSFNSIVSVSPWVCKIVLPFWTNTHLFSRGLYTLVWNWFFLFPWFCRYYLIHGMRLNNWLIVVVCPQSPDKSMFILDLNT